MLADFYAAVLPRTGTGHYALFTLKNKQHVWATSIEQLVKLTELRRDEQGVYFATASFNEPGSRTQANVQALRAFRLDIDAGEKKFAAHPEGAYPTQKAAKAALFAFIKETGLVPTYIVSSGEGLHVYFALAEDVPPGTWQPIAHRLGKLCADKALRADASVTADTARVLRPLGTLHPNGSRVAAINATGRVYEVSTFGALLPLPQTREAVQDDLGFETGGRTFDTSINEDFRTVEGPPKSVANVYAKCGAMREAMTAKGDIPEPYWRAMLGVIKFTVEGLDAAHEYSSGYDGYDPEETERKYEAWAVGPTSCSEFNRHSKACLTCEHAGKIKSPIQLGYMTDQQVEQLPPEQQPKEAEPPPPSGMPWDNRLPPNFAVVKAKDGDWVLQYSMAVTKDDGNGQTTTNRVLVPVTRNIFWLGHWADAVDSKDLAQVSVHVLKVDPKTKANSVSSYLMDQSVAAGQYDLLKWLAGKGIHKTTDKKAAQAMQDYMTLELQRIKNMSRRPKISGRFGLRIDPDGKLLSAHGRYAIHGDGRIEETMLSEALEGAANAFTLPLPPSVTGEWDRSVWKTDIEPRALEYTEFMRTFYGVPGLEKYALAIMLGLASPLMAFALGSYTEGVDLPPNALSVSLYSQDSGIGKTDLVKAVMLAYGHPDRMVVEANSRGSTDNARMERLSTWGTYPVSMDEMGNTSEAAIAGLISATANGKGKSRAGQRGSFDIKKSWALISLVSTNRPLRDMIAAAQKDDSPAIQLRVLELNVDGTTLDKTSRDAHLDAFGPIQQNTKGALGAMILRAVCYLGPAKMNALMISAVKEADGYLGGQQGGRFQYRGLAAVLVLQKMLASMGLAMFDTETLKDTFKTAYYEGMEYITDNTMPSDGLTLLQMALSDLKRNTVVTHTETHRSRHIQSYDGVVNARVPDVIHVRYVSNDAISYVSHPALKEWAQERKANLRVLLQDCKAAGVFMVHGTAPLPYTPAMDIMRGCREEGPSTLRAFKVDIKLLNSLTKVQFSMPTEAPVAKEAA